MPGPTHSALPESERIEWPLDFFVCDILKQVGSLSEIRVLRTNELDAYRRWIHGQKKEVCRFCAKRLGRGAAKLFPETKLSALSSTWILAIDKAARSDHTPQRTPPYLSKARLEKGPHRAKVQRPLRLFEVLEVLLEYVVHRRPARHHISISGHTQQIRHVVQNIATRKVVAQCA